MVVFTCHPPVDNPTYTEVVFYAPEASPRFMMASERREIDRQINEIVTAWCYANVSNKVHKAGITTFRFENRDDAVMCYLTFKK